MLIKQMDLILWKSENVLIIVIAHKEIYIEWNKT